MAKSYTVSHRFNGRVYTEHFEFLTIAILTVEKLQSEGFDAYLQEIDKEDDEIFIMNTVGRN